MLKRVAVFMVLCLATLAMGCQQTTREPSSGGESTPPATTESTSPTKAEVESTGEYAVQLDPEDFVKGVTNPYFPLEPGSRWVYTTTTEEGTERNEVVVLEETRKVAGIEAVVVHDVVTVDGELAEDTLDWYAQDADGAVWYLGEDTKELEEGKVVSTSGSWEAGVDGARPGVVMQADPRPGPWYWQEYYKGEAEDQGRVLSLTGTAKVPAGSFADLLVTEERSPLEPSIMARKYYRRGIGMVLDETVKGPRERSVLETSSLR